MKIFDAVIGETKIELSKIMPGISNDTRRVYYIESSEYTQQSAGLRVPFYLCYILNKLGIEAYINAQEQAPDLNTPLLTAEIMNVHRTDGIEVIAVYINTLGRFFFKENLAVHWVMNKFGLVKENLLSADELVFFWDESYSRRSRQEIQLLRFPLVDEEIFSYPTEAGNHNRSGFAYYAQKYLEDKKNRLPQKMVQNGISMCRDVKRTPQEIADILRNTQTFYTYEETALSVEAALCGCVVVLVESDYIVYSNANVNPEDYYDYCIKEEDFDENASFHYKGVTLNDYKTRFVNSAAEKIANFIAITQTTPIRDNLKSLPTEYSIIKDTDVFLYGAGNIGHLYLNYLKAINICVKGLIISDEKSCYYNSTLFGIPIKTLSWYKKHYNSNCLLVLTMELRNYNETALILDKMEIAYSWYKDAFLFKTCYNKTMTAVVKRFLCAHNDYFIYGIGSYADIIYNTIRATGVNIAGFITPDNGVDDACIERYGLPVCQHTVFFENLYSKECGIVFVMQYNNSYDIIDDLICRGIDYITELY